MQEPKEVTKEVDSMVVLDLAWAHCSSLKIREEYPDRMNTTLNVRQFSDIQKKGKRSPPDHEKHPQTTLAHTHEFPRSNHHPEPPPPP